MKNQHYHIILWSLITLLVGGVLWKLFWTRMDAQPTASTDIGTEIAKSNTAQPHQSQNLPIRPVEASLGNSIASFKTNRTSVSVGKDYLEKRAADHQYDWKQPINFWGRVVDENGDSVAGASIHFIWNDISEDGTSEAGTTSDANGLFSLINQRGKAMTVNVSKEGYYTPQNERVSSFEYANPFDGLFTPDPNNPVVFHLRKRGETEPMIHGRKLYGFKTDGTQYYLNLLTGEKFTKRPTEWDLAISFTCSEPNAAQKFDWISKIETSGGGLFETNSEFMFLAPEIGFDNVELGAQATDPNWKSDVNYSFFFKSRGGIYGRFRVDVYPKYSTNAAMDLNYYVNPSGSRNLEFDPSKEIKPNQ